MIRYSIKTMFVYGLLIWASVLLSQESGSLSQIRREIRQLESQLKAKESYERSLLEQLEDIDRQAGLRRKLIRRLETERAQGQRAIAETERRLQDAIQGYEKLRELVAGRMVSMYKRGRILNWEALLTMSSLNQAVVWVKYQKRIMESDLRAMKQLQERQEAVRRERTLFQQKLKAQDDLIREKQSETEKLAGEKESRSRLLTQVRQEKAPLQEKIRLKRKAYQDIQNSINRAEAERKRLPGKWDGSQFRALKGKMKWPVQGKVVSNYGRVLDPVTRTYIQNYGVDIEGTSSEPVYAVCVGKVHLVTWLRSIGNIVMVTHGGGYYTVYGYLESVAVDVDDEVDENTIIGNVGEKGSLYGSNLHFELWNSVEHENPLKWLNE